MISKNADRYPISAQCKALGITRNAYYWHKNNPDMQDKPDPLEQDVIETFKENNSEYGTPKMKVALRKKGIITSRRRIGKIMKKHGLTSTYNKKKFKPYSKSDPNEAEVPNIIDRKFNGYKPHTHICSDLTYIKAAGKWNYVCLLIDLYNREIVGHSVSTTKNAQLVMAAFAALNFGLNEIEVFHTDRGSEFDNEKIDVMLKTFNIKRSLSKKGCPYDNAVVESTNHLLKAGIVYAKEDYKTTEQLRQSLNGWVWFYNNKRIHTTLNNLSPVEFRKTGSSLM